MSPVKDLFSPLLHPVDSFRGWWGDYSALLARARLLIEKDEAAAEAASGMKPGATARQQRREKLLTWRLSPFQALKELRSTFSDPQSLRLVAETWKRTPILLLLLVVAVTLINSTIVLETVRVRGSIFDHLLSATGVKAAAPANSETEGISHSVFSVLLRLFLLRIAEEIMDVISIVLTENLRAELEQRARVAFFEGLVSQPLSFVDGHTGAELAALLTAAPLALFDVSLIPVRIIRYGTTFAGGLYAMLALDWKLTVAAFLLRAPVTLNLSAYTHRLLALHYRVADDLIQRSQNFMNECLSQIRLIQLQTAEQEETRKYARFLDEGKKTASVLRVVEKMVARTSSFLNLMIELGTLTVASQRILVGALTIGGFHSFKSYQQSSSIAFESLLHEAGRLKNTAKKCAVFFAVLDAHEARKKKEADKQEGLLENLQPEGMTGEEPAEAGSDQGLRKRKGKGVEAVDGSTSAADDRKTFKDNDRIQGKIVFENVFFRYPSSRGPSNSTGNSAGGLDMLSFIAEPSPTPSSSSADDDDEGRKDGEDEGVAKEGAKKIYSLRGVSCEVEPGSYTCIVGTTGSGKTSCLRLLLRLYQPSRGRITIGGRPVNDFNLRSLRRSVAFVDQEATLLNRTIRENLLLGIPEDEHPPQEEIERICAAACILDTIKGFPHGFETVVGDRGLRLSSGERARIVIARAWLRRPTIVCADESTANLDSVSELAVREGLKRLQQSGCTLIMVAHRLSMALQADRIIVIEEGRCVESGTVAELMRPGCNSRFAQLVAAQTVGLAPAALETQTPAEETTAAVSSH